MTRTKLLTRDPQTRFQICHLPVRRRTSRLEFCLKTACFGVDKTRNSSVSVIANRAKHHHFVWLGQCFMGGLQYAAEYPATSLVPSNMDELNVSPLHVVTTWTYVRLKALGQCIPPPRHVLSVSRSGSGSGSPPKFNHFFTGPLPTFPENFMQTRSEVSAQSY